MTYCTDNDLLKYRPDILDLGVDDWSPQRTEAYSLINRDIITRWYRYTAPEMGYDPNLTIFNPSYVRSGELTRLECFKTLELAFMYLKKSGAKADGFERFEISFAERYSQEFDLLMAKGIDYDWSASGTWDDDEVYIRAPRRNSRA